MRLSLNPDPGTGRHWRLSLEVAGEELSVDVAGRDEPAAALATAERVAEALGLEMQSADVWATPGEAR